MKNQTERAHTAHPDITQVTCLLPFSSLSYLHQIEDCWCRGVYVLYTKTYSAQPPSGELSTLTIPITPRPPETVVFITEPLLCGSNNVSTSKTRAELRRSQTEGEECGVDKVSWWLVEVLPFFSVPLLSFLNLTELFTCWCRRSMLAA